MQLSILIPSLESRTDMLATLKADFFRQIIACNAIDDVEVLTEIDNGEMSIGTKRNILLSKASGKYLCFHDDDDAPASTYIEKIIKCISSDCDNCSMTGVITWDGQNPELFEHSIKYKEYKTNFTTSAIRYERYPNHLNVIKSSIAKQFKFPEISHGEDTDWATQIFRSGLLKNETVINGVLYHYDYNTNK